ncbi:putative methyltransferase tdiE [Fusarium oxysporum f. sp. albedinis]|nr:putative methyltransferase tdiE [Fusarium oxysporum f. sp. albedinis]
MADTNHSVRSQHFFMAGGFGLNLYLQEKMKIMAKRSSPSTNIVCFEGDQGSFIAPASRAHCNWPVSIPIVQVNSRASGEGYGLESSTDISILWLVNPGDELSADGQNRRPVPPQAVWHGRDGRSYVNVYRQEGPNAMPRFASCLSWNAVGELQNLEFNFHWDGTRTHYVLLYRGNQQVPLTIENYYDL